MPLMPGSPRPGTPLPHEEDDGVYRSIFQQPVVDFPSTAPSYAWFEFLLHPEALQTHLRKLQHQKIHDAHNATSAIELVREFLEQAQLVADEGNVRNKRYSALLLVAAQAALQMQLSLSMIEQALALHFQRLLLDGIVDYAEQVPSSQNELSQTVIIQPYEAHVLHNRWTLRALVKQSQNGYLTCSTRSEAEEILSTYQMALGDLMADHLQIAQNVLTVLMNDEKQKLTIQTRLETYYDLGVYFFSFKGFEKAYSCFSRALELVEDGEKKGVNEDGGPSKFSTDNRANLEGYLTACEAMLEVQSMNESPALLKTPKVQIEMAWEAQDWDKVIHVLESDIIASELTRLPQDYRAALEQQALRLLRPSCNNSTDKAPHVAVSTIRHFYKRVVMENAVMILLLDDDKEPTTSLEICVCVCIRLLQDEIFHSITRNISSNETKTHFTVLARFVLALSDFAFSSPNERAKLRIKQFVCQLICHFPCIASLEGVSELLQRCGGLHAMEDLASMPFAESLDSLVVVEERLRSAVTTQRRHFRMMADVSSIFAFPSAKLRAAFVAAFQDELIDVSEAGKIAHEAELARCMSNDSYSTSSRNLITFCAANNCWQVLRQCEVVAPDSSHLRNELAFVVACGALAQYLSSLASPPLSSVQTGTAAVLVAEKNTFSITRSNKLMREISLKWREWVSATRARLTDSSGDETRTETESKKLFMCLPSWIVETLVCVTAGLLHRAYIRNTCEYRVSFDLTPYGDLAFLEAFAPDSPSSTCESRTVGATVLFVKTFQEDLVGLHSRALESLVCRCGREPRWHCAKADVMLNPLSKQRLSSTSDPCGALKGYLVAASLATNFFADMVSVVDIIDQSSLVRLSQCLLKVGAHVAAAVLYQCFVPEEYKYGLRMLCLAPEAHDEAFFQYFWELPFLELLVDLHSSPKYRNDRYVMLLTNLIQSPEVNSSNPSLVIKEAKHRILRCYFRDLCRIHLTN